MNRFPEVDDFVMVTLKGVSYYGYIYRIDYDLKNPSVQVEFYPGHSIWFDMSEIVLVKHPEEL